MVQFSNASVYEALTSEDVDFFLNHNPDENGALMFYDEIQESSSYTVGENVKKIIGIFLNIGEEGRSTDEWVNSLNDKAHLMRINAFDRDNADIANSFRVSQTPFLVLLDNGKVIFEEVVGQDTYEHVKSVLYKPKKTADASQPSSGRFVFSGEDDSITAEPVKPAVQPTQPASKPAQPAPKPAQPAPKPAQPAPKPTQPTASSQSDTSKNQDVVNEAEKTLKEAQQISEQTRKQVEESIKALNEARKQIDDYSAVVEAQKKADEAKKAAEEAMKKYQEAHNKLTEKFTQMGVSTGAKPVAAAPVRTQPVAPVRPQPAVSKFPYGTAPSGSRPVSQPSYQNPEPVHYPSKNKDISK